MLSQYDTATLAGNLLTNPHALWSLLDDVTLSCFATAAPPKEAEKGSSKDRDSHPGPCLCSHGITQEDHAALRCYAEMPWFANCPCFSLGMFVANRLEVAMWKEFRASAAGVAAAPFLRSAPAPTDPVIVPTFPSARSATGGTAGAASVTGGSSAGTGTGTGGANAKAKPGVAPSPSPPPPPTVGAPSTSASAVTSAPASAAASGGGTSAAVGSGTSSSAGSSAGLLNKSHLADFWDTLSTTERLKIINVVTVTGAGDGGRRTGGSTGVGAGSASSIAVTPLGLMQLKLAAGAIPPPSIEVRERGRCGVYNDDHARALQALLGRGYTHRYNLSSSTSSPASSAHKRSVTTGGGSTSHRLSARGSVAGLDRDRAAPALSSGSVGGTVPGLAPHLSRSHSGNNNRGADGLGPLPTFGLIRSPSSSSAGAAAGMAGGTLSSSAHAGAGAVVSPPHSAAASLSSSNAGMAQASVDTTPLGAAGSSAGSRHRAMSGRSTDAVAEAETDSKPAQQSQAAADADETSVLLQALGAEYDSSVGPATAGDAAAGSRPLALARIWSDDEAAALGLGLGLGLDSAAGDDLRSRNRAASVK